MTHLTAHVRVLGLRGERVVLACGHEVPRAEVALGESGVGAPRVRACPSCPEEAARLPAALANVDAPFEARAWWSRASAPCRAAALEEFAPNEDSAALRARLPRALTRRDEVLLARVLCAASFRAQARGLTCRELASLSLAPLPLLSGWALARAAARRYEASRS
ncbi:hypothetical protein [Deinococcus yavapaiensis]|uniref:hypothetical protein n=1 Tax=Deinococcus yavapaiensis TaxID=309889 RepID=UPI000DA1F96A|nr:hypothetical protein [Deinococcus yavapaiensis]